MSGLRVLVCGGRDYDDRDRLYSTLDKISVGKEVDYVITGGAHGADTLAYQWALDRCLGVLQYFADWKAYGKAAGPLRNARMLEEGKPDLVVAFPGGRGTADMVARARKAGVRVIEVQP